MKILNLFAVFMSILGLLSADAEDYSIGVSFPYIEGRTECSNSEIARIHHHVVRALKELEYEEAARSPNWEVVDGGVTQDMDAIIESTNVHRSLQWGNCYDLCMAGLHWYCQCCWSCGGGGGGGRRMLRNVQEKDLPDAVNNIRENVKVASTNDRNILCVDTQSPEVVIV